MNLNEKCLLEFLKNPNELFDLTIILQNYLKEVSSENEYQN